MVFTRASRFKKDPKSTETERDAALHPQTQARVAKRNGKFKLYTNVPTLALDKRKVAPTKHPNNHHPRSAPETSSQRLQAELANFAMGHGDWFLHAFGNTGENQEILNNKLLADEPLKEGSGQGRVFGSFDEMLDMFHGKQPVREVVRKAEIPCWEQEIPHFEEERLDFEEQMQDSDEEELELEERISDSGEEAVDSEEEKVNSENGVVNSKERQMTSEEVLELEKEISGSMEESSDLDEVLEKSLEVEEDVEAV